MIAHCTIQSIWFQFENPSNLYTFIKRMVFGKNFKATPSAVYAISVTKDFEGFLAILPFIICSDLHNLLRSSLIIFKFLMKIYTYGHEVPYWCTKFEGSRFTSRLPLVGSKLVYWTCAKKKNVTKIGQELISHELLNGFSFNLVCKVLYMKGIKCVLLVQIGPIVIEIWGVENGDLAVPVNNAVVCCASFVAADTQPCVLIHVLKNERLHRTKIS